MVLYSFCCCSLLHFCSHRTLIVGLVVGLCGFLVVLLLCVVCVTSAQEVFVYLVVMFCQMDALFVVFFVAVLGFHCLLYSWIRLQRLYSQKSGMLFSHVICLVVLLVYSFWLLRLLSIGNEFVIVAWSFVTFFT